MTFDDVYVSIVKKKEEGAILLFWHHCFFAGNCRKRVSGFLPIYYSLIDVARI